MSEFSPLPDVGTPSLSVASPPGPACFPRMAGSPAAYPTIGSVIRMDPRLDSLIPVDSRIEVLASGFTWSEGPVWITNGGFLLFSDIPRNSIFKWKESEGLSLYLYPSGYTGIEPYGREPGSNGLTMDQLGRLVSCEHGDRRISCLTTGGGKRTLVDNFQGKRLNSPNDLVYNSNGDLYFTDPPYGLPENDADIRCELDWCGVYKFSKHGELTLLCSDMTRPNGLAFSPDETTLYVSQSDSKSPIIRAFEVLPDGTLGNGRVFFDAYTQAAKLPGLPDGLKVDIDGNLFATGPGGVMVISSEGELLGIISTGERIANCAWGDDGGTLYLTSDMYLCRIRTSTFCAVMPARF